MMYTAWTPGQTLSSRTWLAGLTYCGYLFHHWYQRMSLYPSFYFAFVYCQAVLVGGGCKGLWPLWEISGKMDRRRGYFISVRELVFGVWPCFVLDKMEGKRKDKNHVGDLPTRFALFSIWGPCTFVPPPLGYEVFSSVCSFFFSTLTFQIQISTVSKLLNAFEPRFPHL